MAVAAAILYTTGRVLFWAAVAHALGDFPTPAQVQAARAERLAESLIVSSSGLFAWIALALGIRASLSERWMPRSLEETRSP